jgi:plastocyanin
VKGAGAGHARGNTAYGRVQTRTFQSRDSSLGLGVTRNTALPVGRVAKACLLIAVATLFGGCRRPRPAPNSVRAEWIVHIKDFRFQPGQLTVRVGDHITWINDDSFQHSASADDQSWGTRLLDRGQRWLWVPETPGRYSYHCFAHPTMRATLTVLERPEP